MNFMISILGWFLWNWIELIIEKKSLDDDGNPQTNFSLKDFASKKWAIWIGSFFCIPLLLWIESAKLSIDPLAPIIGANLGWNHLYILGAGPALEMLVFVVMWIKKFFKKKQSES